MANITEEEFLKATLSQVSQVYNGKRHHCRCGCGGNYIATSYMENPRSEVNDALAEKRLKRAQKLVREGADVDFGDTFVDVECGNNRALTFYFDEVKQ